jgi:GGDEF domain-containing protein
MYSEDPQTAESELQRAMNNVLHMASMEKSRSYDFLTGLPNMTYFFEQAEVEKEHILQQCGQPILLYIDFSGMKFLALLPF